MNGTTNIDKDEAISRIEKLLSDMENNVLSDELTSEFPDLQSKLTENQKLKYRLDIMKRAAPALNNVSQKKPKEVKPKYINVEDFGDSMIERLTNMFDSVLKKLFPDFDGNAAVRETANIKNGDYDFSMAPLISQWLLKSGIKKSPNEIARLISENLPKDSFIEETKVIGIYVNIFVRREFICRRMLTGFLNGISIPKVTKKHVIVDYSAPNIAKQMHVGHLRSTIIGESICRLLEAAGFSVLRLNHIGDWGTQFGMLIAYLKELYPNYMVETPPLEDLQRFYKQSKIRFDEDKEFEARARQCVVQLQNHDPDIIKGWKIICDKSREDFDTIYKRLDVSLVERGESFYQDRMVAMIDELQREGKLVEEEGRKLYFPKGTLPLTLVKSDGGFTYDTSDMAAIKQRLKEEKADWILYVVDRGQNAHLEAVYAAAREWGLYDPAEKRVEHIQFGLVLGEDKKKFKSRSGDTVKLTDLLDEGIVRAEMKLLEKGRENELTPEEFQVAKEAVAYGCIKYTDLSSGRTSDYVFSFDRMLDDRGNTAVYLLYAYARIRSIVRTASVSREQVLAYANDLKTADKSLPLTEEPEFKLGKQLLKFADCILVVLEGLQLHKLCDYVYDLATIFHDFYNKCYVVSKSKNEKGEETTQIHLHRLILCELTANVMKQCFDILGIRSVERM